MCQTHLDLLHTPEGTLTTAKAQFCCMCHLTHGRDHSHTLNLNTLCCFAYIPVDIDLEKVTGGASMIDDEL